MDHLPVKIIAEAATSPAARHYAALAHISLTKSTAEPGIPGGYNPGWCNHRTYKTAIAAAVMLCNPTNFMEIGVRRGHCLATALAVKSTLDVYGFDLWLPDYGGESNPGPDFVRSELSHFKSGFILLCQGRSQETVPKFKADYPMVKLDLIGVDGSHTVDDTTTDLTNSLSMLAPDGVLIMDDIAHPSHPDLLEVWRKCSEGYERHEVLQDGYGFGILRNTK